MRSIECAEHKQSCEKNVNDEFRAEVDEIEILRISRTRRSVTEFLPNSRTPEYYVSDKLNSTQIRPTMLYNLHQEKVYILSKEIRL